MSAYTDTLQSLKTPATLGPDGVVSLDPYNDACYTLPAAAYTTEGVFCEEQDKIFNCSWAYAGHASSLPAPGCYTTAQVHGEDLVLVRDKSMEVRAFFNACPHRGHHVVKPGSQGRRAVLVCPNHAWSFKLDGTLHRARKADQQPVFDPVEFGLKQVRLEEFNGLLFVNLTASSGGLFSAAPALAARIEECIAGMADMQLESRVEAPVEANWKCLVDNFLECYHCDTAHKDFVNMVDMDQYLSEVHSRYVYNYSPCRPDNSAYKFRPDDPCQAIHYFWLWPNTVIYTAPGAPNMSILEFIPVSAGRTLRRAQRFFVKKKDTEATPGDDIGRSPDDDAQRKAAVA